MMSHSNAEQEEPSMKLSTMDSKSDVREDVHSDVKEEEMAKWLSTTYERGSKKPMREPLTAPWGLSISDADMEKLKAGFKSRSMDDKWDILVEDPDENGHITLHILRSWLQEECYMLHIVPKPNKNDGESAKIQCITWEGNKAGLQCDAEQAQKEAVMLSRSHLHCEFETLPNYPSSLFWDPKAYRRLNAE